MYLHSFLEFVDPAIMSETPQNPWGRLLAEIVGSLGNCVCKTQSWSQE